MSGSQQPDTTVQTGNYQIDIYHDWPVDKDLENTWNRLVASSECPNVFMTWEWSGFWWKWFGNGHKLRLLVARNTSGVAAILPLYLQRSSLVPGFRMTSLRLVGDGGPVCPDFLGPILGMGSHDSLDVIEALGNSIVSCVGAWQIFKISDVVLESPGICKLISTLERHFPKETENGESCPFLKLPDNYESFLGSLGASQRESIRRRLRKAKQQHAVRIDCVTALEGVDTALESLLTIFDNSERGKCKKSGFNRPDYTGFHADVIRSFADKGWLRLLILHFNDIPVAFLYGYRFADVFYFYQTGYDLKCKKDGVGSIVLQASIERAITERCSVFEFLRGSEDYKYHFAQGARQSQTITYWRSKGFTWIALIYIKKLKILSKKICRYYLYKYKKSNGG